MNTKLEWCAEVRIDDLSGETAVICGNTVVDGLPFKIPKDYDERYIKLGSGYYIDEWRETLQDEWWKVLEAIAGAALDAGFAVAYDEGNLVICESPRAKVKGD